MRAVLQRVTAAAVHVEGKATGRIGHGLLVLLGVARGDTAAEARRLARKAAELRIFPDDQGRFDSPRRVFDRSLLEIGGEALVVSQFTLLADTRRGRRPSFAAAAPPEVAGPLVEEFAAALREAGIAVQTGLFGAHMQVELVNDGPVTIVLDSRELERPRRRRPP